MGSTFPSRPKCTFTPTPLISRIILDNECPVNVAFSDDNRSFVVITNIKNHYKCNPHEPFSQP
jgi:hypothetical protein